jgi:hypothetical protein
MTKTTETTALTTSTMTTPSESESETATSLIPFAPNVWIIEGPIVDFFGFPCPTRSVVIRLGELNPQSWVWSPIGPLSEQLAREVEDTAGPVAYLISPNKLHWIFLQEWKNRFPQAKMLVEHGLVKRDKIAADLAVDGILTNDISHVDCPQGYKSEIDQMIIHGGVIDEVIFFHKATRTVIFCDLIQRHLVDKQQHGWKAFLIKADGLVGPHASTPKEWRFCMWACGLLPAARRQIDKILYAWQPQRVIIAHGENATERATEIIAHCLRWIPETNTPVSSLHDRPQPQQQQQSSPCQCCLSTRTTKVPSIS